MTRISSHHLIFFIALCVASLLLITISPVTAQTTSSAAPNTTATTSAGNATSTTVAAATSTSVPTTTTASSAAATTAQPPPPPPPGPPPPAPFTTQTPASTTMATNPPGPSGSAPTTTGTATTVIIIPRPYSTTITTLAAGTLVFELVYSPNSHVHTEQEMRPILFSLLRHGGGTGQGGEQQLVSNETLSKIVVKVLRIRLEPSGDRAVTFVVADIWTGDPHLPHAVAGAQALKTISPVDRVAQAFGASLFGVSTSDAVRNVPNDLAVIGEKTDRMTGDEIATIVGAVVGGLALVIAVVFLIVTRNVRGRRPMLQHVPESSGDIGADGGGGEGPQDDAFHLSPVSSPAAAAVAAAPRYNQGDIDDNVDDDGFSVSHHNNNYNYNNGSRSQSFEQQEMQQQSPRSSAPPPPPAPPLPIANASSSSRLSYFGIKKSQQSTAPVKNPFDRNEIRKNNEGRESRIGRARLVLPAAGDQQAVGEQHQQQQNTNNQHPPNVRPLWGDDEDL